MFDAKNLRAKVSLRHATWQSYERAYLAARLISWLVLVDLLIWFSGKLPTSNLYVKVVLTLVASAMTGPAICKIIRRSLLGFLANRVFSTRIVSFVTSEAIGIQTYLFPNGIVIWRKWNGQTVKGRLSSTANVEATQQRQSVGDRPPEERMHFETARTLRLIISTDSKKSVSAKEQTQTLRAITLSCIDERIAEQLSVVLSAALALTVDATSSPKRKWETSQGIDIDTN